MRIYIASSWKNQHAVEMLTERLREQNHEVLSWIENNYGEGNTARGSGMPFEEWVTTDAARRAFKFDTDAASVADLVIYVGPAGTDAWAEVGIAWRSGATILGLWAKGEPSGLMRHLVTDSGGRWFDRVDDLISWIVREGWDIAARKASLKVGPPACPACNNMGINHNLTCPERPPGPSSPPKDIPTWRA